MNKLFLTAITGECALFATSGIRPRGYNPFTLLRQQAAKAGVKLPNKHLPCLMWLRGVYADNGLEEHRLLDKAIRKLETPSQKSDISGTGSDTAATAQG